MNFELIKNAWRSSSVMARICFAMLLVLLFLFGASAGARVWEGYRENAFDKREAAKDEEVNQLGSRIDELKLRAERAEAKAGVAEQKAETLQELSMEQGKKAQVAAQKVDDAFREFQEESNVTNTDVTEDVRRKRICEKRRELGYPCGK
jgi:3-oxoacyl-[acyl-carrier-protein] synthase III